jgi:2-polyprenyl-3-methyl-5-hydroxy-6-metoxy-1,4-benzoquinol methylase
MVDLPMRICNVTVEDSVTSESFMRERDRRKKVFGPPTHFVIAQLKDFARILIDILKLSRIRSVDFQFVHCSTRLSYNYRSKPPGRFHVQTIPPTQDSTHRQPPSSALYLLQTSAMAEPIPQRANTPSGMSTTYLPTTDAYNLWAKVYDSDGNFLQALDTIEMKTLFPRMLSEVRSRSDEERPLKLVDLGCGTGRNTVALLGVEGAEVVALDASEGMLNVARKRLSEVLEGEQSHGRLKFEVFDLLSEPTSATDLSADAIVSTLVIEHIPCDNFFTHVSRMLKKGGVLCLTNMHADMGKLSQAGFVDETGRKVRPVSYAHSVEEVVASAEKCGLELIGEVAERRVTEDLVAQLGERSRKYVGVMVWFGGLWRKV